MTTTELAPVVNQAQMAVLTQRTPEDAVRWRQGKGGRQLAYVDHAYVTRTLNEAFGWDWDFEADNEEILYNGERPFEVRCRGRLTVRFQGRAIVKVQFGCQPIEFMRDGSAPVSLGDAFKGAASDALKKCASLLGIALDLYDSDDTPEPPRNNGGARYDNQRPAQQRPQAPTTRQPAPAEERRPVRGATPRAPIGAVTTQADKAPPPRTELIKAFKAEVQRAVAFGYDGDIPTDEQYNGTPYGDLQGLIADWKALADELVAKDAAGIPV